MLNGPQGTLYGSNSMAGNIRFITRKPDATAFNAYAEADWSSIEDGGAGYGITAVINAPLVRDKLALRLVGYREDRDGWIDQTRLERTSGRHDAVQQSRRGHQLDGHHRRTPERALDSIRRAHG